MKICDREGPKKELGCSARLGQEDSAFQLSRITERSNVGMPLQRAALSPVGPGSQGLNTPVTPKTFALELSLGKPTKKAVGSRVNTGGRSDCRRAGGFLPRGDVRQELLLLYSKEL